MNSNTPTISSLTIAELASISHAEVLRDIHKALARLHLDPQKFAGRVFDNGERKTCFLLPRRECDLVISEYAVVIVWPSSTDPALN